MKKIKTSLRFKAILIIILSVFAVTAAGIIAGTLSLSASINKTTGENYAKIASAMAYSVAEMINTRVELIKAGAGSEIVTFAVKAINSKYGQGEEAGKAYLMDMDKKWIEASPGHSLIKEYLDSNLSLKLRSMVGSDGKEAEILVTDRYGGLVASSRKTPDFYQGGKQWWQEAFDGGKGSVVIGDILFDEATKLWCVPFAVPVHDEEGRVIGIYRSLTDISLFSGPLEGFRIGNTGNAALIDDKGYLIYHPSAGPFTNKLCEYKELERALEHSSKWLVLTGVYMHAREAFAAYAEVAQPLLLKKGMNWRVFITRDAGEVFRPVGAFIGWLEVVAVIIVAIASLLAVFLFNSAFAKPFGELREGMEHAGRGELGYRVNIETGDEIEGLAESFNRMREGLTKMTVPVSALEKETQARQKAERRANAISADFSLQGGRLREEIAAIKSEMKSIMEESPGRMGEKRKKSADVLETDISRLENSVNEIADAALIERGKLELKIMPVDLRGLVKDEIFVFEPKIREKGLDLKLDMPPNKIMIDADEARLKQVCGALVENAIKFTEKGGIDISIKEIKDAVECSITDSGLAISRDAIPLVFERTELTGATPGQKARGGGSALFVAKGIVEAHHGKILVESDIGKRTKFTLILPLRYLS